MKKMWIFTIIALILALLLNEFAKKQEAKRLVIIRSITAPDARVVWSEWMSGGEIRNFTYWNNDHCSAVIGVRGDDSYYVSESTCSEHKLTKD